MIWGRHYITLGCSDAARTADVDVRVPDLRRVKKTVTFDDPDGYVVELATAGPGFTVAEDPAVPGRKPPWLEGERKGLEPYHQPLPTPAWHNPTEVA